MAIRRPDPIRALADLQERVNRLFDEVRTITGRSDEDVLSVELFDRASAAANPAFDVTPSRYVTALITERGVCSAERDALARLRAEGA